MPRRDFRYRAPTNEDLERRANQTGYEFKGVIKDQYKKYRSPRGENRVRMLPQENSPNFAVPIYVHYAVGPEQATVLCLEKMRSEKCPLCEDRAKAERRNDNDAANELKPTRRSLVWMINRNDERDGPLLWDMPWTIDRDLAKLSRDRRTGEIFAIDSPDEGFDITFDREGEGINTKYTGMAIARRSSPIEKEWLDYILDNPLSDVLVWRDYDEVQALYQGVVGRRDAPARERETPREEDDDAPKTQSKTLPWDDEAEPPKSTDPYDEKEKDAVRGEKTAAKSEEEEIAALRAEFKARRNR